MNVQQFDVVIIGLGTVGAVAAQTLSRYGLKTAVFESQPTFSPSFTIVHHDEYTRHFWQTLGITPHCTEIDSLTLCKPNRRVMAQYPAQGSAFPARLTCSGAELTDLLQQGFFRYPNLTLFIGCRVELITKLGDSVSVMARRDDGTAVTVQAQYLIGCDGANSLTRIMAGIGVYKSTIATNWLVVETKTTPTHPSADRQSSCHPSDWQIICHPYRPAMCLPGPAGQTLWAFALRPEEAQAAPPVAAQPALIQRLLTDFAISLGEDEIIATQMVSGAAWSAVAWRNGRIFIAGSAAHQFPFMPGLNLSQSMRDIANLAWRLNLVIRHQADPALLDGYETERTEAVHQVMETAVQLALFAQAETAVPLPTLHFARPHSLPAALIRTEAGQVTPLNSLPQGEFSLIGVGVAPQSLLSPDDWAWAQTLKTQCWQVTDLEGVLVDYKKQVFIVRPDGVWDGTFSSRNSAQGIARWRAMLGGATAVRPFFTPAIRKNLALATGALALAGTTVALAYLLKKFNTELGQKENLNADKDG